MDRSITPRLQKNKFIEALFRGLERQTIMQRPAIFALSLLTTIVALGQSPAPIFEVASIKPAAPGQRGRFIRPSPGGRLDATNMPLKDLIQIAYKIQPFQIIGAAAWMDSEAWDIVAKAESDPGPNQTLVVMLQGLLADRFALKFHRETREMPVYTLVAANSKGKATPGLTAAKEGGCVVPDPATPFTLPTGTLYCGNIMGALTSCRPRPSR